MKSNKLSEKEIVETIDSSLQSTDNLRKEGLEMMKTLHTVKLEAEEKRLKQKQEK